MDNNETCEELVLSKSSTIGQDVNNASVSGLFTKVLNLLKGVPSMSKAVEEVKEAERCVEIALKDITSSSDPEVRSKLIELRKEFRDFIRIGKDFLENCLSMAKYVKNEQHVTEINQQLARKILDELKVYIDSLSGYLKDCDESFEIFRTTHKEIEVSCDKEFFSDQLKEAKEEARNAEGKHERAVVEKKKSEIVTAIFANCNRAGAAAGTFGIIPPDVAVFASLFSSVQTCLASMNEGKTVLNVIEQERVRTETAKREKIFQDAMKCVVDLRESVSNAVSLIEDMKFNTDRASKVVEQRRGLQEFADSNKEDIDFHDLTNKMDKLQRAAGEILKVIGEEGITPISRYPDELVSNTQALQTTDVGATTYLEAVNTMKALTLSSQTNGSFSNPPQVREIASPLEQAKQELGDPQQAELVAGLIQDN